jgi:hypothetical protein
MSRGDLHWQITFPADGSIAQDGLAPALICWSGNDHPAMRLEDKEIRFKRLELVSHHPEQTTKLLSSIGLDQNAPVFVRPATGHQPKGLIAYFETPRGVVKLGNAV